MADKSRFGIVDLGRAMLAAYFFPLIMSGLSGILLNKPELVQASYSSIALPSLASTVVTFVGLGIFQAKQIFLYNRIVISACFSLLIGLLSLLIIRAFHWEALTFDIIPSALLGTIIVGMTKPLKKLRYEKL